VAVSALSVVGGCGMQLPSVRSPFYLANDSSVGIQQNRLNDDNIYVPPEVEHYCRGPNFDPNADCTPPKRVATKQARVRPDSPKTVIVQRGDTLYSIARRHRIPVEHLADENGLDTHHINVGQQLDLPHYATR